MIKMKKASVFFLAATALFVASCTSNDEASEENGKEEAVAVTYNIDVANSSLEWATKATDGHGHMGNVAFQAGTLTMKGDAVSKGNFVVDMYSIESTDLDGDMKGALEGHLKGTIVDDMHPVNMFFNVESFPTVKVELGEYKDGNLEVTLNVVGAKLTQSVPVSIKADGEKATISGDFSINMESTGIMGFQKQEDGSQIGPNVDFKLNAVLTK